VKKIIALTLAIILTLMMALTLTACGDNTSPVGTPEPTPEATPTPTPESTPEPCGHEWLAATCDDLETCSICEETQGTPLGHEWKAANFQEPEICLLCDVTEGDPLTPGAVTHDLELITALGETQYYRTRTARNNLLVLGDVTLSDVSVSDAFNGNEAKEGNEYLIAEFVLVISGEDARSYGFSYLARLLDYYTYDPSLKPTVENDDSDPPIFAIGQINYYGVESEFIAFTTRTGGWGGPSWNREFTLNITYAVQVPVGYNGAIVAFANTRFIANHLESLSDPDDFDYVQYLTEQTVRNMISFDTLYFRLRG